jgi:hypothetical protein
MTTHKLELNEKYDHYDYPTTSPNVQSGHPGHTTPEQDAQVFQLRTQLEQAGYTERLDTLTMVRVLTPQQPLTTDGQFSAPVLTGTKVQC